MDNLATPDQTKSLADLAVTLGDPVAGAGNKPIQLDDPNVFWFVERGAMDVFLVEQQDGAPVSGNKHVLRVGEGRLAFGVGPSTTSLVTIAKGTPESKFRRIRLQDLPLADIGGELADQADAWLSEFAATVAQQIEPRPIPNLLLDPRTHGESLEADAGAVLSSRPGGVTWVAVQDNAAYLETEEPESDGTGLVPLTVETWLTLKSPAIVTGISSLALSEDGRLLTALSEFHRLALGAEDINRRLLLADEANEQTARTVLRRLDKERATRQLFNVLEPSRSRISDDGSTLMAALHLIGEKEGIIFRTARRRQLAVGEEPRLQEILESSGVRSRKIRLSVEDRWWLGDSGAILAFTLDDGRPVALLPSVAGRYVMVDPVSGKNVRIDASRARELDPGAWSFYRPLPDDRLVGAVDLIRLISKGVGANLGRFVITGLLVSALTLAPAIAVGVLADWVLPAAVGGMLIQVILALIAFALVGVMLQMLHGTAMMRIEARAAARLGAAVWDRLLNLPPSFFRNFTAGELAVRMGAVLVLRDQVSGVVANALLSAIFVLPTLGLLFLYDMTLAWLSIGIALLSLVMTAALGVLQIGPQRRRYRASRRLARELFQFINGMSKLRSAGAEASAFAAWARGYREQHLAGIQIGRVNEHLVAFNAAVPSLAAALLFGVVLWKGSDEFGIGDFLVVYAVSMTFFNAAIGLGHSFGAVAAVVPGYEQIKPILDAVPDNQSEEGVQVDLSGDILFDHVSFRYSEDGPPIIDDVSIQARSGEFVAIVGESGAGKSTLLRLALGLEQPTSGSIYYDGRDLRHLNSRSVRKQIGVVMQDSVLQPGDILDNIIGMGDDLNIDDAWEAARLAAVDEDLAGMPMGMFTTVNDTSAIFSGGQVQRIKIAAALVRDPRIMFLDEATSWLDASSQAKVMQGIESLAATRIVIAHRLSTIRKAERIYVLEAGRVVQEGSFDELYETEGTFRDLVQRQMT